MDAAARHAFRRALSRVPAPVAIVTTRDETTSDWGVTLTAFGLLSQDPPLVHIVLYAEAGSTPAFATCERFALSVLAAEHEDLAERFATGRPDKFILGGFERAASGLLVVPGAVAVVECARGEVLEAGDHVLILGAGERAEAGEGEPLVYVRGAYAGVSPA